MDKIKEVLLVFITFHIILVEFLAFESYSLDQVWFGLTVCQVLREKAHSVKDYIEHHCKLNCCGNYTAAFLAAHIQIACVKFQLRENLSCVNRSIHFHMSA